MNTSELRAAGNQKTTKCVVWDLDNTLWDGVLLEDEHVVLREGVDHILRVLDQRGILHSIASKNEHSLAMARLEQFGISEYFLYPQINWNSKSSSLKAIAAAHNIGVDALAFVDDQAYERAEVAAVLPGTLCIDALDIQSIPTMPRMTPGLVSKDAGARRQMYLSDIARRKAEQEYTGPSEGFLRSLNMVCTIGPAQEGDLHRAEELTVRTSQLNSTGYTYSYAELDRLRVSDDHALLMAALEDRFGSYGTIGLALVHRAIDVWTIKLLLMSCRVAARGIGTIMTNHIMRTARDAGVSLRAEFIPTDRNRIMYVTLKFSGFKEVARSTDRLLLESDLMHIQPTPTYLQLRTSSDDRLSTGKTYSAGR
jgi:FkbH-like protein